MQYSDVNELPAYIKNYSIKVKRQWMHVFNTTYAKTDSEVRAIKAGNSVLKTRFEKTSTNEDYHSDVFNRQIDGFLGNLKG